MLNSSSRGLNSIIDLMIIKIFSITAQEWKKINTCQEIETNLYLCLPTKDFKINIAVRSI